VKTWSVLNYLKDQGHEVTLASFVRKDELESVQKVRQTLDKVHMVPLRRSRYRDLKYGIRSQWTGRPFLVERDDLSPMRQLVAHLIRENHYDAIHTDQLTMAQFAFNEYSANPKTKRIFDAHNAVWTVVERVRKNAPSILKPLLTLETNKIKRYEAMIVRTFDHTLSVTSIDRQALMQVAEQDGHVVNPDKISVIPIAVNTQLLQPVHRSPDSMKILTLGTLRYPPNADGIRWFIRDVFPLIRNEIPQARLTIIGKDPPSDFYRLVSRYGPSVSLTGYVPDLTPDLESAAVMVIPVRAGGGMRVRILEAFSRGMPVVTTSVGLEGIDAKSGEHVLVEDSPQGFASATIHLLKNPEQQSLLSKNSRLLAESTYDWQIVLKDLNNIYANNLIH